MSAPIGQPRVRLPQQMRTGEVIEIRTLITHVMETGQRRNADGAIVPRDIIRSFVCRLNGAEVFAMELAPAIAANPYIAFPLKVEGPGTIEMTWTTDSGEQRRATAELRPV
jgi:sulfur-oxidizing protein SoxZ